MSPSPKKIKSVFNLIKHLFLSGDVSVHRDANYAVRIVRKAFHRIDELMIDIYVYPPVVAYRRIQIVPYFRLLAVLHFENRKL